LLPLVAAAEELSDGLAAHLPELATVIPADGLAVVADRKVHLHGVTPPKDAIGALAEWLLEPKAPAVRSTSHLGRDYPPAESWPAQASGRRSGVLRNPASATTWCRAGQVEPVSWAGNPRAPRDPSAPAGTLCPRRSLELWVEQVRGRS